MPNISLQWKFYTEEEIRKLCVIRVTNASTYDRGTPKLNGVNDPRLGLGHVTGKCPTCNKVNCDQHMGYLQLAKPVYKIGTINYALQVLRCVCRDCAAPKFWLPGSPHDPTGRVDVSGIFRDTTTPKERLRLVSEACKTKYMCASCAVQQPNYTKRDRTFIEATYKKDMIRGRFNPEEGRAILEALDDWTKNTLELVYPEEMIMRLHIIPPPCIRPSNFVGENKVRSENDLTLAIQDMVRANMELENAKPAEVQHAWDKLQIMASGIVLSTIKKVIGVKLGLLPLLTATAKRKVIDMKVRLSGKKGRFRGNLSGKRVDQSGRSVIAPDSSHDITQLGVPSNIMNTLTFPEMVNDRNLHRLQQTIVRGAYVDNGAMAVRRPGAGTDDLIWLPILDQEARIELASQIGPLWTVERHLVDGDWVLFNRQPSLWKASMMAFTIYRLKDKLCFQLSLPVAKPFNADFDGDEMNLHSLQSYQAIAEAQELLSVPQQMFTPQSNTIIIGLVQDSLVGAFRLTDPDTFLDRTVMSILLSVRHYDPEDPSYEIMVNPETTFCDIQMPMPAILKAPGAPQGLFTGKQLVSMLLPSDISMRKVVRNGSGDDLDNNTVLIRNGEHLSGQLCKAIVGATNHGLIQMIYSKHGSWAACKFVSDAQRLFVTALMYMGPSISIVDCLVDDATNTETANITEQHLQKVRSLVNIGIPKEVVEAKSAQILQETLRHVGSTVAERLSKNSGLYSVVTAGSKGNLLNIAQIGGTVGQQMVFGRRVQMRRGPLGSRTLACFSPSDSGPESRGYIKNSYLKGLRPHEFFYHQMSGREGIVATAVNTADSGYNQRRMIKSQESQCIAYDGSVRVSSVHVVVLSYGFDDLDGAAVSRFRFDAFDDSSRLLKFCSDRLRAIFHYRTLVLKDLETTVVCPVGPSYFEQQEMSDDLTPVEMYQKLYRIHQTFHGAAKWYLPAPVAVAVLLCHKYNVWSNEIPVLYYRGLVCPGEGVGALAATCIGEPSMQMTLNVFHYSGIASKNVTITGLPRFRQIINAVDTTDTANMNAELVSFEHSTNVNRLQCIKVSHVAKVRIENIQDPMHKILRKAFRLASGNLTQRLYKKKTLEGIENPWSIVLDLDYTLLERYGLKVDDIAGAIMKTMGTEALVFAGPHWTMESITVIPFLHELDKQYMEAFGESLLQVTITGIEYVKRAIVQQETRWSNALQKYSVHAVDTEGSSLIELGKVPFIKPETAMTNNIVEIANVLGINAGISVLQAELHKVLSFDSSYIDPRHTWLLSDTMCRAGSIFAMNRHNMEHLGNSILQRASFEQSLETLNEAAVFGRCDSLRGATERIMVGQPANVGTGLVSIVQTVEMPKQILVPRLHDEYEEGPTTVPALHRSFDLSHYNIRILDEPKDHLAIESVSVWRSCASQYRIVAQIMARQEISYGQYQGILLEAKTTEWSTCTVPRLTTIVPYDNIVTIVSSDFSMEHKQRKIYHEEFQNETQFTVFFEEKTTNLPVAVVPKRVLMRHESSFTKFGFTMTIVKEWTGANNVEVEHAHLHDAPNCFLELLFFEPENILQSRVTNAQITSAFFHRLA